jgi:heme-degrading monooxygenase HmoA
MGGSSLPALGWGKTPDPSYYVAIFTSNHSGKDVKGFAAIAERLVELVRKHSGFLAMDSVEGAGGVGIVVAYWKNEDSIRKWKQHLEHMEAQSLGRQRWLRSYQVRVGRVERAYGFDVESSAADNTGAPDGAIIVPWL